MRKALYFLGILRDSDIEWLIGAGRRREIGEGAKLIEEGVPGESVFLVIDGSFSIRTAALGTREIARIVSGEVLGELSFVDAAPPSATVLALERSFVLAIPRTALEEKLAGDEGFASRFYRAMSMFLADRLRSTLVSFARKADLDVEVQEETAPHLSREALVMAGARFDVIQKRLRSQTVSGPSDT